MAQLGPSDPRGAHLVLLAGILSKMLMFFGDPSATQKEWVNGVLSNPKNFGVKIKSHEKTQAHLDASITFGRWRAVQLIDRVQAQAIATEVPSGGSICLGS